MKHHLDKRADSLAQKAADSEPDELLDTTATAAWLDVSTQWLEIGRSRGWGPPFVRIGPRRIRYRRRDVLRWLDSRTRTPAAKVKA